jgi:CDGSH-type Zn-finger protein/uncharacterized Fe-S cluster protein YjdI
MSKKKIEKYTGKEVDVFWDGRLCIHMAECGQSKDGLFVGGRQPWCVPDAANKFQVREVIERCPSGALSYDDKGSETERTASKNSIHVTYNGPLFVKGDLEIEEAPDDMPGVRFRAALCRCGHSKNKPFCDNSHGKTGFRDFGAVGEQGSATGEKGGKLKVKPIKDGPLLCSGNVTINAGSGRVAWQGDQLALCRCGKSKNKPFCDGSHKAAGFKSD